MVERGVQTELTEINTEIIGGDSISSWFTKVSISDQEIAENGYFVTKDGTKIFHEPDVHGTAYNYTEYLDKKYPADVERLLDLSICTGYWYAGINWRESLKRVFTRYEHIKDQDLESYALIEIVEDFFSFIMGKEVQAQFQNEVIRLACKVDIHDIVRKIYRR